MCVAPLRRAWPAVEASSSLLGSSAPAFVRAAPPQICAAPGSGSFGLCVSSRRQLVACPAPGQTALYACAVPLPCSGPCVPRAPPSMHCASELAFPAARPLFSALCGARCSTRGPSGWALPCGLCPPLLHMLPPLSGRCTVAAPSPASAPPDRLLSLILTSPSPCPALTCPRGFANGCKRQNYRSDSSGSGRHQEGTGRTGGRGSGGGLLQTAGKRDSG